ncbi:MAG: septal ring lytic transglycosylase RlpA family protein [Acidobacteriota bacterium]
MKGRLASAAVAAAMLWTSCATAPTVRPPREAVQTGEASWYGQEFAGRATANGEIFDPMQMTAAHQTLPFGTIIEVQNQRNGRSVRVRINDRGPFVGSRVLDLSYAAARELGMIDAGVVPVTIRTIDLTQGPAPAPVAAPAPALNASDAPPPVPFPLPEQVGTPIQAASDTDADVVDVEVIEERNGVPVHKAVSPDGRTIVRSPDPKAAPSSPPKVFRSADSRFVIQLGSFQQRENAATLREKVARLFSTAFVEQAGTMFRVRVGPFPTRDAAAEIRDQLENSGFSGVIMRAEAD